MSLKEKIQNLIGKEKEPIKIENLESLDKLFAEKRDKKLAEIEKKSREFTEEADTILENINESLQILNDFEDSKNRSVVNDVVENIYEKRKNAIKEFEPVEDSEELEKQLKSFSENFQDLDRKEKAVLDEAKLKGEFSKHLLDLEDLLKNLENFNKNDYQTKERYKQIQDNKKEIKRLKQQKNNIEHEINQKKQQNFEQELKEKQKELEDLKASEEQEQYLKILDDLEKQRNDKEKIERKVGRASGKMERGLKKLLYEGQINKIDKQESQILRQIRDQNKQKILESNPGKVEKAIDAVLNSIKDSTLDEKTKTKLKEGANQLENFKKISKDYENAQKQILELQNNKENHSFKEKRKRLQKQISDLEEKQENQLDKIQDLENQKKDLEEKTEELKDQITSIFQEEFDRKIKKKL